MLAMLKPVAFSEAISYVLFDVEVRKNPQVVQTVHFSISYTLKHFYFLTFVFVSFFKPVNLEITSNWYSSPIGCTK